MNRRDRLQAFAVHWRFQLAGIALLLFGLGASVWLAFAASSAEPPSGAQSALLVIIGGALNAGGVWTFSRRPNGANLTAARIAARHLGAIAVNAASSRQLAEDAFDDGTTATLRWSMGELSVRLSGIEEHLGSNLEDWAQSYPDLIARLAEDSPESSTLENP